MKRMGRMLKNMAWTVFQDNLLLKASALSYYTLVSLVPVLAVAFAFAKGFGFDKLLESQLLDSVPSQYQSLAEQLLLFTHNMLQQTEGAYIAGIGIIVLLWSVIGLFSTLEAVFNDIWRVPEGRGYFRKITDYLALTFLCPLFFVASSSLTLYAFTFVLNVLDVTGTTAVLSPIVTLAYRFLPILLSWVLFTFMYLFVPNTQVSFKPALMAGLLAGTVFHLLQWIFIKFQIGVAGYGAVYGSFAALPLFLLWVQTSWLITLMGAEAAYGFSNEIDRGTIHEQIEASSHELSIWTVYTCVEAFQKNEDPPTVTSLANTMGVSRGTVNRLLRPLLDHEVLVELDRQGEFCFQPGRGTIGLQTILHAQERPLFPPQEVNASPTLFSIREALKSFDTETASLMTNVSVQNLH